MIRRIKKNIFIFIKKLEMQALFTPYKKPESGKLLLSEPFLKDAYFSRSVILLAEHNEEGEYSLII